MQACHDAGWQRFEQFIGPSPMAIEHRARRDRGFRDRRRTAHGCHRVEDAKKIDIDGDAGKLLHLTFARREQIGKQLAKRHRLGGTPRKTEHGQGQRWNMRFRLCRHRRCEFFNMLSEPVRVGHETFSAS
ncbi:hypothetical protein D3C81_1367300 [compost metagenome]